MNHMLSTYAFVFPGQGSQSLGMLTELATHHSLVQEQFAIVSERVGYDVWQLTQQGPVEQLNQTMHTQVAMLTADVVVYQILAEKLALAPKFMAGHSLGEYAALVCAGALSLSDAAALVNMRGQLMQEVAPLGIGAMAAIVGLTDSQVEAICEAASDTYHQVTPANYNAIGQVVIAGHTAAVNNAIQFATVQGARLAALIPVSVPCHCALLQPAAELFADTLEATVFHQPQIPVISNVDLSIYTSPEHIRTLLKAQLYRPVRWVETIQMMQQAGVTLIVECGPGKVLCGLIKRIDKSLQAYSVNDPINLNTALALLSPTNN